MGRNESPNTRLNVASSGNGKIHPYPLSGRRLEAFRHALARELIGVVPDRT